MKPTINDLIYCIPGMLQECGISKASQEYDDIFQEAAAIIINVYPTKDWWNYPIEIIAMIDKWNKHPEIVELDENIPYCDHSLNDDAYIKHVLKEYMRHYPECSNDELREILDSFDTYSIKSEKVIKNLKTLRKEGII